MPNIIKAGWLKNQNGENFAPKTLASQVQTNDGILLEDKMKNKIDVADIVDNLTTNVADKPLSAAQGYELRRLANAAEREAFAAKSLAGNAVKDASNAATAASNAQATADGKEAAGTAATMLNRTTAVNADDTNYTTYMARGMSLNAEETSPTVNGTIAWHYK